VQNPGGVMALIVIAALTEIIDDKSIEILSNKLKAINVPLAVQDSELDQAVENDIDEDSLLEFMNSLEDESAAADAYVPGGFSEIFTIGEMRIGSLERLLEALDDLEDEFGIVEPADYSVDDDDDEEEEEEADKVYDDEYDYDEQIDLSRGGLKLIWSNIFRMAQAACEAKSNLIIKQ
jgi:hypothetical protein